MKEVWSHLHQNWKEKFNRYKARVVFYSLTSQSNYLDKASQLKLNSRTMRTLVFKAIIHIATKLRNGSISSNSSSSSMRHAVSPPTFERSTSLDNLKAEVVELVRWFYKCITKHCMQLCVRVFVHTFRVGTTVKNNQ